MSTKIRYFASTLLITKNRTSLMIGRSITSLPVKLSRRGASIALGGGGFPAKGAEYRRAAPKGVAFGGLRLTARYASGCVVTPRQLRSSSCASPRARRRLRPQQPYYFRNNADLSHYVGVAATIDNVNVNDPPDSEIEGTQRPFSITQPAPKQMWDLTLEETIKIALQNAKVIRSLGGAVQGPPAFLTANPTAATTIYDPAIVETDARFGIAAGESLFDPTWTTDMFWERNHEPRNVNEGFAGSLPLELNQDAFQFQTGVSKTTADGTVLSVSNSTVYDLERNDPTRQTPSDWEESFQMEIRKPLLQGAGVEFNQIAGPARCPVSTRACCWPGSIAISR